MEITKLPRFKQINGSCDRRRTDGGEFMKVGFTQAQEVINKYGRRDGFTSFIRT